MSIREFARQSGIAHTVLNKILAGEADEDSYPSVATLVKLARYTHVDVCTLIALLAPDVARIDARARAIAERIGQLPPVEQEIIDAYILGPVLKQAQKRE
jgi:transcriptional regulator with XRE-family HTH domain